MAQPLPPLPEDPVAEAVAVARRRSDAEPHRDHLIALLALLDDTRQALERALDYRTPPHTRHLLLMREYQRLLRVLTR